MAAPQLFKAREVNFESLGIGGLDAQFEQIFRRAFASRVFPASVVERLGIRHVKGVLLFGPPGTGMRIACLGVCMHACTLNTPLLEACCCTGRPARVGVLPV